MQLDGASHADDMMYMFETSFYPTEEVAISSQEYKVRSAMCGLWTNFAKWGNPTPGEDQFGILWTEVGRTTSDQAERDFKVLDINHRLEMIKSPFSHRVNFWKQLFKKYNGNYLKYRASK